ncbi:MAG TPA: peptide deformylase [Thermoanaerobaculia bacterium]|nr:peptide deformylase [Thermoanaerobaculia bacterium]
MAVRPILRLGNPVLRTPARAVDPAELGRGATQDLIDDLIETMRAASGVGIAAPQVGADLQIFLYERHVDEEGSDPGYPDIPLRVVVNPMVAPTSHGMIYDWEGCLSIPDLRGLVPRYPSVRLRGLDRAGRPIDFAATGFEARIIQHEFDHLNGIVFLDRMRDLRSLAFTDEWHEFLVRAGSTEEAATLG